MNGAAWTWVLNAYLMRRYERTTFVPFHRNHSPGAKLLPQISARVVVYGGANRQCRRDGAVVPLADLGEVLERFERRGGSLISSLSVRSFI